MLTKYFKILDHINIDCIIKELNNCPDEAWQELDEWVNPKADKIYDLYKQGLIPNKEQLLQRLSRAKTAVSSPDTSREQQRLHIIWQFASLKDNEPWWLDHSWRTQLPTVNPKFGNYFSDTIAELDQYWKKQNKVLSRLFFSKIQPGKQVYPHTDGKWGENYNSNQRYGLVVTTNDGCELTVADVTVNPAPGTLYWFDSREIHSATNPMTATNPRIFLYMDVLNKDGK